MYASLPRANAVPPRRPPSFHMPGKGESTLAFGASPWCDVKAAASQRTADFRAARAWAPLRWLSLGSRRKTRACRARALRRASWIGLLRPVQRHCDGGRPLSFGARPWRDVPVSASSE